MQSLKTCDPTIMLSKSHREHTRHDNLDTAQTTGKVFWSSLINHNNIYIAFEIIVDEELQVVSQIHVFRWIMVETFKGILKGLLLLCMAKEMHSSKRLGQIVHERMRIHYLDEARICEHLSRLCSVLLRQLERHSQDRRKFA